jgi:predicted RNA-binding Zn-ribbon protein involved in translation (DUF1610 family)
MQFPDRSDSIAFYTDLVRRSRTNGDFAAARSAYTALAESWKQQNINRGGALQSDLDAVKREFSDFVKTDPVYHQIRDAAIQIISQQPGILQTEIYGLLSVLPKEQVQYALYFAAEHGVIIRTKKGRSYGLSLATASIAGQLPLVSAKAIVPKAPDIRFSCQECGKHMVIESAGAGATVVCPECHKNLVVPEN